MQIAIGLLILLVAGFFQGTFVMPMTLTKKWNWENTWFAFSLLGMVILNLVLAFIFIPNLLSVYGSVPVQTLLLLVLFGLGWGIGAVLFGIAMDRLGMSLGYPIIMGMISTCGALIPLLVFHAAEALTLKGLAIFAGSVVVFAGIVLCAKAHALKAATPQNAVNKNNTAILVAVAAGMLSCLPNVGFSFGEPLVHAALARGASAFMAGNAVWALFFCIGFIPNAVYTVYLLNKNKSFHLFTVSAAGNSGLGFLMALMWIGSFYLYGVSTIRLGSWGAVAGWPLFISLSIIIGNIWGIVRLEWRSAPQPAALKLRQGIAVIFAAIVLIAVCNLL